MLSKLSKVICRVVGCTLAVAIMVSMMPYALTASMYNEEGESHTDFEFADVTFEAFIGQDPHEMLVEKYGREFVENHDRSSLILDELFGSFPTDRTGAMVYPADFGGVYIDADGNLVLLVVSDVAEGEVPFSRFSRSFGFEIREVEFSLNELEDVFYFLFDFWRENPHHPAVLNSNTWYIDEINNQVMVWLLDYSEITIQEFLDGVLNSPMLTFMQCPYVDYWEEYFESFRSYFLYPSIGDVNGGEGDEKEDVAPLNTISINLGADVRPSNYPINQYSTVGYRTFRNGKQGFVTASHTGWGVKDSVASFEVSSGNNKVGRVVAYNLGRSTQHLLK